MNKKIVSLLLAMIMLLVPVAIAHADDTVNITVDMVVFTFNVSVDTNIETGLTLKIVPLTYNTTLEDYEVSGAPIHLDECTTYTVSPADANLNRYTFDAFNVFQATETGKYRAIVNGTYTKDFDFVNKNNKIAFYNRLAAATVATWETELQAGVTGGVVDFDLGGYFGYPSTIKTKINTCLDALALQDLGLNPTDAEVTEFETMLKPEVARVLKAAELATVPKASFASKVTNYGAALGLDLTYYSDPVLQLDAERVCERLNVTDYSVAGVQNAFDLACLLAMIDTSDYGTVTEALTYYNGGCVNLNTALTTSFTPAEYNSLSNKLKLQANTLHNGTDVETAYTTAANEVIAERGQGSGFDAPSGTGPTITGSTTVPAVKPTTKDTFSDLGQASWAKTAIEALTKKGVLSGKGDGKFYPNDTVTREEFVKIIVEAVELEKANATASFSDVASDRWSYSYITTAYNAGIINGTGDGEFSPAGQMSRQDMAVIMKRVADLLGIELKGSSQNFSDTASIASYAKDAVKALSGAGIINGTGDNAFSPKVTVTRAQAAKVVYELLVYGGMI